MISVKVLSKTVERFVLDNAPIILTGAGAVGAVGATVLAVKASFKASLILEEEEGRRDLMNEEPLTKKLDAVKLVWKEYIPTVGVLSLSVTSIICSNRVSTKRAAAMAAAYSLSEKAYSEYREKITEKFNANKERQVRDEIAQDHVTGNPQKDNQVIMIGNGDVRCYDLPTDRYFSSNMEKLRSIQNDINALVIETGRASLLDFYNALGLKETMYSEELGWTSDQLLDLHFSAVLADDAQPCIAISYKLQPLRGGVGPFQACNEDPDF